MNADTIKRYLDEAQQRGDRLAVGFADRSFFIESIQSVGTDVASDGSTVFSVVGLVYDTGHSRQATPEEAVFESSAVVSLARPASLA